MQHFNLCTLSPSCRTAKEGKGRWSSPALGKNMWKCYRAQVCVCCCCSSDLVGVQECAVSPLRGLAGDGRDVQQTFHSGDHSFHPFLFHLSTSDLRHSKCALVWLEVPQQHQSRSVKHIREAGEMLFHAGLCLSLSWDSKGEIWLSCASCCVGVCIHSSQMKRLEMKTKSCGVRTAQSAV